MPEIQTLKLKQEKRFTRKNDEDFDLLCKCLYSVYGDNADGESFLDLESGVDIPSDMYQNIFEKLVRFKFKQKGVEL